MDHPVYIDKNAIILGYKCQASNVKYWVTQKKKNWSTYIYMTYSSYNKLLH